MNEYLSSLHDARLLGVQIIETDGAIKLTVIGNEGQILILLKGVKAFRLVDMQLQNVIYQITRHSNSSVKDDEAKKVLNWISSYVDAKSYLSDKATANYLNEIREARLVLMTLEPSSGAELGVLCEAIEIEE